MSTSGGPVGGGGGGIGNNWINVDADPTQPMASDTANPITWELGATNGSPQWELNVDTFTMDCTGTGIYVVCMEFALAWTLTVLAAAYYPEALVEITIASSESLGGWLFTQLNATIDPKVALNTGYYLTDYTTPPFAAAAGDSLVVRQLISGAVTAGVDPLCGGALSIARVA